MEIGLDGLMNRRHRIKAVSGGDRCSQKRVGKRYEQARNIISVVRHNALTKGAH